MAQMLRKRRHHLYMSLRDLAKKSGVAYGTIWRIEHGKFKRVQPRTARALALALGVQPEQITEFSEIADQMRSTRPDDKSGPSDHGVHAASGTSVDVAPSVEHLETEDVNETSEMEIPVYDLADLLAQMRPETFHNDMEWGSPVGREVW